MTTEAPGKQIYHEGSMIDGSFTMTKFFETSENGLVITVKDQVSGHTGEAHFDDMDLSSLSSQLKEESKSKNFCKGLLKRIGLVRSPTEVKLTFKDLIIENAETKRLRKEREEAERKAKEEAERLAKEEAERKAKEEEERLKREEEARLERERIAKEEAERDAAMLAALPEEERNKILAERAGLGTTIIDSIETRDVKDMFKDEVHLQMERPQIKPNTRKHQVQVVKSFAQMEEEEKLREEQSRKPKDKVDQDWDDPYDLLPELKKAQKQKDMASELAAQLLANRKAIPEEE